MNTDIWKDSMQGCQQSADSRAVPPVCCSSPHGMGPAAAPHAAVCLWWCHAAQHHAHTRSASSTTRQQLQHLGRAPAAVSQYLDIRPHTQLLLLLLLAAGTLTTLLLLLLWRGKRTLD